MSSLSPLHELDVQKSQELMDRYYAGENITALIEFFGLSCRPSELCRHFPPDIIGRNCPGCGSPLVRLRGSRAKAKWRNLPARCLVCNHEECPSCQCQRCAEARSQASEKRRQRELEDIADRCARTWSYDPIAITPGELSAEETVALLSLVRCGGWLDEVRIGALGSSAVPFAPNESGICRGLIEVLLQKGLIAPAPDSEPGALNVTPDNALAWNREKVSWHLLFPDPPRFVRELENLALSSAWPDDWRLRCHLLWRRLAAAECAEFCSHSVDQRRLPMPGTVALAALIDNLLSDFSVSQCYQLIWGSAADATDFRARNRTTAQHAANYLIGACQRRADRSRAEGWAIRGFHRNFQLPRSQLSLVLHDVILKHGETGFYRAVGGKGAESGAGED